MILLIKVVLSALAILITSNLIPGFHVDTFQTALITAIVLGFINAFVRPVLLILTAPITLLTLGLFVFVLNLAMFYLAAWLVPGFSIDSLLSAVLGAIVMSVVAYLLEMTLGLKK